MRLLLLNQEVVCLPESNLKNQKKRSLYRSKRLMRFQRKSALWKFKRLKKRYWKQTMTLKYLHLGKVMYAVEREHVLLILPLMSPILTSNGKLQMLVVVVYINHKSLTKIKEKEKRSKTQRLKISTI